MILNMTTGTVAAAGSAITDAATVEANFVTATASDGTKGVILSRCFGKDAVVIIKNTVASALKVYPQTSAGTINGGSAGAAYTHAASKSAMYINVGADTWHAIQLD